ncbi:MAG: hypothetical protein HQ556_07110 [Candidatus Marinimicrobia bacterium]|nr:hypothetical protein [Candidatus Neomarinimicrobiota bacterium]
MNYLIWAIDVFFSLIIWIISNIGDVASVAGVLLTIYIALHVKKVKKFRLINEKMPGVMGNLEANRSTVIECLNDFNSNKDMIKDTFSKIKPDLVFIKNGIPGDCSTEAKNILKSVMTLLSGKKASQSFSETATRDIYRDLLTLEGYVNNYFEQFDLER